MNEINKLREKISYFAKSIYDRGLTHGSTGNISVRTSNGGLLVTPTGSSMGDLQPDKISYLDKDGRHISGDLPTKEMPLHNAFYDTRSQAGAVVHLHSSYSVAYAMLPDVDPDNVLPPMTPYSIMQLGKVKLLPYFHPGDKALGEALKGLAGKHSAVILANHGPVVASKTLDAGVYAIEELEETAKLALLLKDRSPILLNNNQITGLVKMFGIDWD